MPSKIELNRKIQELEEAIKVQRQLYQKVYQSNTLMRTRVKRMDISNDFIRKELIADADNSAKAMEYRIAEMSAAYYQGLLDGIHEITKEDITDAQKAIAYQEAANYQSALTAEFKKLGDE